MLRLVLAAAAVSLVLGACKDKGPPPDPLHYDPQIRKVLQDLAGGHVFVLKQTGDFTEHRDVAAKAAQIDKSVVSATSFTEAIVKLRNGDRVVEAKLRGVPIDRIRGSVAHYILEGSLFVQSGDPNELALGVALAKLLGVKLGDRIGIQIIDDGKVRDPAPPEGTLRVSALLSTDLAEYDDRLAVTTLAAAQTLSGRGDVVMGVELALKSETDARRVATALQAQLGNGYKVTDWCELNAAFLGCTWTEAK